MNIKVLLLLGLAGLIAFGTFFFVRSFLNNQPQPIVATPAPLPQTRILVAKQDIRAGTILRTDDLRWQDWPDESVSPHHIREGSRPLEGLTGYFTRQSLSAGEPISEQRLLAPGTRGFLAAVLSPDMRAMSVAFNHTTGVAGLIQPGDRVDVLITISLGLEKGGLSFERRLNQSIVRNVRVLAIDQRFDTQTGPPSKGDGTPERASSTRTATLEVSPRQAQLLTLATEVGHVSLVLNSAGASEEEFNIIDSAQSKALLDTELTSVLPPIKALQRPIKRQNIVPAPSILRGGKTNNSPKSVPAPAAGNDSEHDQGAGQSKEPSRTPTQPESVPNNTPKTQDRIATTAN